MLTCHMVLGLFKGENSAVFFSSNFSRLFVPYLHHSNLKCQKVMWVFPKIVGFPPKWMVYIGKPLLKWDDLGGTPIIFGNTKCVEPHVVLENP